MAESHRRSEHQGGVTPDDIVTALGRLGALDDADATRLMGTIMARAGEVFVLRAQLERLTRALAANDVIDAQALAAIEVREDMQNWLLAEESAFARALTAPFLQGDRAPDSTRWMREE